MQKITEAFFNKLKSPTILKRKPNLKICSNHLKDNLVSKGRRWYSGVQGTAYSNGQGWYK